MTQQQIRPGGGPTDDDGAGASAVREQITRYTTETDDLLDEIDGILETNAEEFVRSYVQKGGQ